MSELLKNAYRLTVPAHWRLPDPSTEGAYKRLEICKKLYSLLYTGLGDRISLIHISQTSFGGWDLASSTSIFSESYSLTIGLLVNPEQVDRAIDRGPEVGDKKTAKAFREFWGDKAELRRFKDGSILESVIWKVERQGSSIPHQVINYLIGRHLGRDIANSLEVVGGGFTQELAKNQYTIHPASLQSPWEAFKQLETRIRNLEQLPLDIRQISPSCSGLSDTTIDIHSQDSTHLSRPLDIIIQFESSVRWPDDIHAIQRTKIAFLLKIGELLEQADPSYSTFLGLENEGRYFLNTGFLDILGSFFSFRVRVHHDRELALLDSQARSLTISIQSRNSVVAAISCYKRIYIHSPIHTETIRNLCTRFPLLAPTIRLLKCWCVSHLLLPHIPEEFLELLVARVFLHPYPFTSPGSLRTGLLQTLTLIARWDWRTEPLLVSLNGKMDKVEVEAMQTRFDAWRKVDPAMNRITLFVGTSVDQEGIAWTTMGPQKVVAGRMTALAKAACAEVKIQGLDLDSRTLFISPTTDYDFIIYIDPVFRYGDVDDESQSVYRNFHTNSRAKQRPGDTDLLIVFFEELERLYGQSIVLFHGSSTKGVITGLWGPSTESRQWKVNLTFSTTPPSTTQQASDCNTTTSINKAAILNEIARLGGLLISNIDITNKKARNG